MCVLLGSTFKLQDHGHMDVCINAFSMWICTFKGSTLKLLGNIGPADDGEWAIVGGTGELTLAQGVVSFKKVQGGSGMIIRELKFRVFYTPIKA